MAAPPSLPRQQLRYARMLDAAAVFARKGLESVTLAEVAAEADVPLGTLYRYFPSATHLMLALYRKQLSELQVGSWPGAGNVRVHALVGVAMEIFHMRVMQPAVEQCLSRSSYHKDAETSDLLREIDAIAERAVTVASGDRAKSRLLLLAVTGLVHSVRCRRLSLFEAEEDLKEACTLLATAPQPAMRVAGQSNY
jgi:AcrR family transcriptional regulator